MGLLVVSSVTFRVGVTWVWIPAPPLGLVARPVWLSFLLCAMGMLAVLIYLDHMCVSHSVVSDSLQPHGL